MKRILYLAIIGFVFFSTVPAWAQVKKDSNVTQKDTARRKKDTTSDTKKPANAAVKAIPNDTPRVTRTQPTPPADTLVKTKTDTAHRKHTVNRVLHATADSLQTIQKDTSASIVVSPPKINRNVEEQVLLRNKYINAKATPAYFIEEVRHVKGKEFLFYALCVIVLILGLFRTFYQHYFNNLFRVFFNTSLRQTQLTDQLMQARLPSFILNIFFTLALGVYIWLLFMHFHPPRLISNHLLLPFCIVSVAVIYFVKFCILKFMGWVSDIREATDNYIFVIFLINKITGILLVPVIIVLAFSLPQWISAVTTASLLILGLFFLSRYVKSYAVIERRLPLNPFHFIIYILGAEIIPLMIIYKVAIDYVV